MTDRARHIIVVGGGTAGSVLGARLSESPALSVTLLEAGPDHDAYDSGVLDPALASAAWTGATTPSAVTPMHTESDGAILVQTIPSASAYLGCVMVAERVSSKMLAAHHGMDGASVQDSGR